VEASAHIPVSLITGFLGSGKTTLLGRLLHKPGMADTAVIINEFGEIGLDHELVESSEDNVVLLASGCLCCTIHTSLVDTLRRLFDKRRDGSIPAFNRVLVETTGLADPAPIIHTLMNNSFVRHHFKLDCIITTVDVVHGWQQLDQQPESVKQAAVADRLVLTKMDIAKPGEAERLTQRLKDLNPGALVIAADHGDVDEALLFGAGLYDPSSKSADVMRWLNAEAYLEREQHDHHHHDHDHEHGGHDHGHGQDAHNVNRHDAHIQAHCLIFDKPLNWRYFSPNLASLISRHAEKLLRVKGILNVEGEDRPVVVHGVQEQFQRLLLNEWPSADRRSKLVLITRDLDRTIVSKWLQPDTLFDG